MSQLSSINMIYLIMGVKSCSPTFLVECMPIIDLPHTSEFLLSPFPYKMHSPCNVPCVIGVIIIITHTHIILTIQYN